jgi:2-hydroxychromene-2-carboxylate isomerase
MKRLIFHFDVVSPYAYLAFECLPQALEGCSYWVEYRPVLFAGLLKAFGHKGPAEIAPKKAWMQRQVAWLAQRHGVVCQMPTEHPFNPLPLLRLALASTSPGGSPSRRTVELLMHHVWQAEGADPTDPQRLAALRGRLSLRQDPDDPRVKQALRDWTQRAVDDGVFGVPMMTLLADSGEPTHFWGVDSLPMLRAALQAD